ncbi:MAG: pyridoxamine 5'-phosphate oxidase family protein [Pseudomonadales bacterium]|nr:pyridoxamine 5'-phosphate oxidase family protein [Pseudomonadales bacterium]
MSTLESVALPFIDMAHQIVWCTIASVDAKGRPRSRILHPIWEWDGAALTGWIATNATPTKRAHLAASPYLSANYWTPSHDTCVAECHARWAHDAETKERAWDLFENGPEPVGYDPRIIPGWESPDSPGFSVLKLTPWRLCVFPGTVLLRQGGEVLTWQATD